MSWQRFGHRLVAQGVIAVAALLCGIQVPAQEAALTRDQASLVVDGVVREVFRSDRQTRTDYILLVEVSRADLGPNRTSRVFVPAPGESVYVHTSERSRQGASAIPSERSQVRLYLSPRSGSGWDAVATGGIELASRDFAPPAPSDPEAPAGPAPGPAPTAPPPSTAAQAKTLDLLGIKADILPVSGRIVLRVSDIVPGGPAQKAGIEKGDVIVGVGQTPFSNFDELARLLEGAGAQPSLAILDARTGKAVPVPINLGQAQAAPAPGPAPAPRAQPNALGISLAPVQIQGRTFLRVVDIQPGSPAQKAGLEKGDIIAGAGNQLISSPEELSAAVQAAGNQITLVVIDVKTGKPVPVPVELAPAAVAASPTSPAATPAGSGGSLGITTEQTLVDLVPALKVTSVTPGSPAQAAGLEVGDVIFAANETVTIVPELLEETVKKSGSNLVLSVLDPRTNRRVEVKVNLGQNR